MNHPTRTSQQWIDELTGVSGEELQAKALEDLSHYLYVMAINSLSRRKNRVAHLSDLPNCEIERYAEDFAQETILKLAEDNWRRISQFRGEGKFTAWVSQIIINRIRDELRTSDWHKCSHHADRIQYLPDTSYQSNPERQAMSRAISESISSHVKRLSPKSRTAFTRCLVDGLPVAAVAKEMGLSANAVYIQISRGKEHLRRELQKEGVVPGV